MCYQLSSPVNFLPLTQNKAKLLSDDLVSLRNFMAFEIDPVHQMLRVMQISGGITEPSDAQYKAVVRYPA